MMDYRNNVRGRTQCCPGRNSAQTSDSGSCGCTVMEQVPVMVYIVQQEWSGVYPPCRALSQGTLFPVLDKPFFGKGGCCCD